MGAAPAYLASLPQSHTSHAPSHCTNLLPDRHTRCTFGTHARGRCAAPTAATTTSMRSRQPTGVGRKRVGEGVGRTHHWCTKLCSHIATAASNLLSLLLLSLPSIPCTSPPRPWRSPQAAPSCPSAPPFPHPISCPLSTPPLHTLSLAFAPGGRHLLAGYQKHMLLFDTTRPGRDSYKVVTYRKRQYESLGGEECVWRGEMRATACCTRASIPCKNVDVFCAEKEVALQESLLLACGTVTPRPHSTPLPL